MNLLKLALIMILTFAFATPTVLANQEVATEKGLGEKLLRQLWADMQKPDMEAIEKTIAKGFQAVHQYGSNNREQEIKLIEGLKIDNYTLSNIQITRNGPVIVATYFVSVEETIKEKRLSKKPAPRLSVFLETDSGWKWIAHANLKPLD
ncbi:MAG: nuclear transport factor 2 family protein [Proteobacteria bacterium]|nr:nuclear transport factor 2 family protein [Desulfobacteraceae bacterium]MBU2522425.1 nuclear transport factor 2 family protein [Pseudomonadota bacterium]MBU3980395.1 nuclear transport factor 2 family protein [Pseudomonadota bacterium]MBU4012977.1 nuclear transport factor 2 family protein [Pseudomonadota bacterium]MBU4067143.1 nuclear transport factor 2 family protein [Pseudomonadota bacterium]